MKSLRFALEKLYWLAVAVIPWLLIGAWQICCDVKTCTVDGSFCSTLTHNVINDEDAVILLSMVGLLWPIAAYRIVANVSGLVRDTRARPAKTTT